MSLKTISFAALTPLIQAIVTAVVLLWLAVSGNLAAEPVRKHALLIANSAYEAKPLQSPERDAQTLANKLRSHGFLVQVRSNLDKRLMGETVSEFAGRIREGDVAFFYFSGYGLSSLGQTFLIAVDARIKRDIDIWQNGLSVKTVLQWLGENSPGGIVLAIDAARRHPAEKLIRAEPAGLTPDFGAENTLTIYSASPGKVFEDDSINGSIFGKELAAQVGRSDLEASEAFNRVRVNVARQSRGAQVPLVMSTLIKPLTFSNSSATPEPSDQQPSPSNSTPTAAGASKVAPYKNDTDSDESVAPLGSGLIRDCTRCPVLVVVPAGSFVMGSSLPYQKPQHRVSISQSFAIGRYEVSFEEWDACVDDKGCDKRLQDLGWGRDRNPVINVSWADAKQYLKWLSKKTDQTYRLPSEAEWEYAARAGTRTPYWWGADIGSNNANCAACQRRGEAKPRKVGSYAPNPFGLYDTSGNVAEWVEDCWNASFRGAPMDGSAWLDGQCSLRVLRGGAFDSDASQITSSFRFRYDSYVPYSANGFRVVREIE